MSFVNKLCQKNLLALHNLDNKLGAPEHGIAPGTKFDDLPEDFECPICGVGKDLFEEA